jgi:hypothetical protein
LKPKEAKGKKGVFRQGEWFAVPVNKKDVPKVEESLALGALVTLPVDDEESEFHTIHATNDDDIRINKDGRIFARYFILEHEDHAPLEGSRGNLWYAFYHNNAVASVSTEGVD